MLALSVEEHAESSKERPRKDENAVMRCKDEGKREGDGDERGCVSRGLSLWERREEKGTASLEAKARKKIGPKPDRKRLVPEGVRDFLGWKPQSVYPPSRRLTWRRPAGAFIAHSGAEKVPDGYFANPLLRRPWRCGL